MAKGLKFPDLEPCGERDPGLVSNMSCDQQPKLGLQNLEFSKLWRCTVAIADTDVAQDPGGKGNGGGGGGGAFGPFSGGGINTSRSPEDMTRLTDGLLVKLDVKPPVVVGGKTPLACTLISLELGVKGHRKRNIIEEDEPIDKSRKYMTWEEDDSMVMAWIMNNVQPQIASSITYYTTAKEMLEFLRETYSQDKNLAQPVGVTPAYALAVRGGCGQDTTYSARGRGIGRGTGGSERFQCT
ncbi:hypothetical protein EJ110_NYTH43317 [Nymphaea thermarum]|nr:hypothetical protein EJ110_NYTH43317 [Nymphaea thermarum]